MIALKKALLILGAVLFALGLVLTSALLHLRTAPGRLAATDTFNNYVSGSIPGTTHLSGLSEMSRERVVASRLVFKDPNGTAVIDLRDVVIRPDVDGLMNGEIAIHSGQVGGGEVLIAIAEHDRTSLENAFSTPGPSTEAERQSASPIHLRNLEVSNLSVSIHPGGGGRFELDEVRGPLAIERAGNGGVRVELKNIGGRVRQPEILGEQIIITSSRGAVAGSAQKTFELYFQTTINEGAVRGRIRLFDRQENPIEIDLHPEDGLIATLGTLGGWVASLFASDVDFEVHLGGGGFD